MRRISGTLLTLGSAFAIAFAMAIAGCQANPNEAIQTTSDASLRPLSKAEALADLRQLSGLLRTLYGPYEFKEARFGYKISDLLAKAEQQLKKTKSDDEVFGVYAEVLAALEDGHVSIDFPLSNTGIKRFRIPMFVFPVEGKAVVGSVGDNMKGSLAEVGDELVAVDGKSPFSYLSTILKYEGLATKESEIHSIFRVLNRPSYMTDLKPTSPTVKLRFRRADGSEFTEEWPWEVEKYQPAASKFMVANSKRPVYGFPRMEEFNRTSKGSYQEFGSPTPFFLTPESQQEFNFVQVHADARHRTKFGLKDDEKPEIFAALYEHDGARILLVRSYTYDHEDFSNEVYMKGYRAILNQWEPFADVLVLDQTHNGGGSYCEDFYRLFIQEEQDGVVTRINADRNWIISFHEWADWAAKEAKLPIIADSLRYMASEVEKAYDAGLKITKPLAMWGSPTLLPDSYTWKKPMLVLADELAGSCADIFPMLIKHNKTAKIFGEKTMGLGGSVEALGTLTHSRITIYGTRSLFTSHRQDGVYTNDVWVENNGVVPDYRYTHTLEDFRNGFVKYIETFSDRAVEQIP
jgi:hypothetical protein